MNQLPELTLKFVCDTIPPSMQYKNSNIGLIFTNFALLCNLEM